MRTYLLPFRSTGVGALTILILAIFVGMVDLLNLLYHERAVVKSVASLSLVEVVAYVLDEGRSGNWLRREVVEKVLKACIESMLAVEKLER